MLTLLFVVFPALVAAKLYSDPCPWYEFNSSMQYGDNYFPLQDRTTVLTSFNSRNSTIYNTTYFCFMNRDSRQGPTIRVNPGGWLYLTVYNELLVDPLHAVNVTMRCADLMSDGVVNVHFHGTHTSPECGGDQVLHTMIAPNSYFTYSIFFPLDHPPGLYWYHPHIHGMANNMVNGGATGAIVVNGIENVHSEVGGLDEYLLVIREGNNATAYDYVNGYSVNYIPILRNIPARLKVAGGKKYFFRIANAGSTGVHNISCVMNSQYMPMRIVAWDGAPVEQLYDTLSAFVPASSRIEFIVDVPISGGFEIVSISGYGHLAGATAPFKITLVDVTIDQGAPKSPVTIPQPAPNNQGPLQSVEKMLNAKPVRTRTLIFSQNTSDSNFRFYVTVMNEQRELFRLGEEPKINAIVGDIEDWVIINASPEEHEFHIHQMHFLVWRQNGVPLSHSRFRDTITVPPPRVGANSNVTIRINFTSLMEGYFVYHCHVLFHEDHGMMHVIRVLPREGVSPLEDDDDNDDTSWWLTPLMLWTIFGSAAIGLLLIAVVVLAFNVGKNRYGEVNPESANHLPTNPNSHEPAVDPEQGENGSHARGGRPPSDDPSDEDPTRTGVQLTSLPSNGAVVEHRI